MGAEIELKLATSKRGLQQAMALPWLKKRASDGSRKQELASVYFDTDDCVLREHDIIRKAGAQRLQTIKTNCSALVAREEPAGTSSTPRAQRLLRLRWHL